MNLLDTVIQSNDLCAHAIDYMVTYKSGVITRFIKNEEAPFLTAEATTYALAGVLQLGISANGDVIVAQTATKTVRYIKGVATEFTIVGPFDVANDGTLVVLNTASGSIQIVTATTRNVSAALSSGDRVSCGTTNFMVYSKDRYIKMFYTASVAAPVLFTKPTMFVHHVASNEYALFHKDGNVTYKGMVYPNKSLQQYRSLGKWVTGLDGEFDWGIMRQYPLSAAKKIRPNNTPLVPDITLIYEKTIVPKVIGGAESYMAVDSRLYIPTYPITSLSTDLVETVGNIPTVRASAYTNHFAVSDTIVVLMAQGSSTQISKDRGVTWTPMSTVVNYNGGKAIPFKNRVYISEDKEANPMAYRNYDPTVTSYSSITIPMYPPPSIHQYSGKNANCVVAGHPVAASSNIVFIGWNFPTFVEYNIGLGSNVAIRYFGSNIFCCTGNARTILLFVPATQGTPVILKTWPTLVRLNHIGALLTSADIGSGTVTLKSAMLAPRVDNTSATLAQATAYAAEVEAAYANLAPFFTLGSVFGEYVVKWGDKRLVLFTNNAVRIWEA